MGCYGLWPGDAVVLALYVLLVIVLLVTMIRSFCSRQTDDVDGVQQSVPAPPETAAAAPSLPCFPYAAQEGGGGGGGALETTAVCAICLEPLRRGQPCAEVPACRHAFHGDCARAWARSSNTCPLCRAKIAPGLDGAT